MTCDVHVNFVLHMSRVPNFESEECFCEAVDVCQDPVVMLRTPWEALNHPRWPSAAAVAHYGARSLRN